MPLVFVNVSLKSESTSVNPPVEAVPTSPGPTLALTSKLSIVTFPELGRVIPAISPLHTSASRSSVNSG